MFEEICLVCGKHLQDDGRAYCSDDCQSTDLASPSISSSSSALSSPQLGYAQGLADVPPLMPSALGSALRKYQAREPYCVNPSASSSNPWSLVDEDEDSGPYGRGVDYGLRDGADSTYDGSSKSASFVYNMMPSALSYARRPSGTNNHSVVPQIHQRNSSGSSPGPYHTAQRGAPRSAPNRSHSSTDEEDYSDYSLSSRDAVDDADSDREYPSGSHSSTTKSRRTRNRASLPACFSLLQISTSASTKETVKTSPVSSSSAKTIARPSPPTPRHPKPDDAIAQWEARYPPPHPIQDTPRGRRRDTDRSQSSRYSERSSPSRARRPPSPRPFANTQRARVDSKGSVEQVFDWDNTNIPRGRTSVRRNSSPPPRMFMGVEDPGRVIAAIRDAERFDRSRSDSKSHSRRGRVGVDELEGVGTFALAPGYGNGRSGLMDRERFATSRVPL